MKLQIIHRHRFSNKNKGIMVLNEVALVLLLVHYFSFLLVSIIVFLHKHAVRLTTGTLVINIIYFVLLDRLMMAAEVSKPTRLGIFNTKLSDLPMINADHLLWMNYVMSTSTQWTSWT